jgi:hypothetical protein
MRAASGRFTALNGNGAALSGRQSPARRRLQIGSPDEQHYRAFFVPRKEALFIPRHRRPSRSCRQKRYGAAIRLSGDAKAGMIREFKTAQHLQLVHPADLWFWQFNGTCVLLAC